MTTVIGLAPNQRGAAAVHLGSMLARSLADDVVVATIVPAPWPPNPHRMDAEYLAHREEAAQEALAVARTQIGPDLSVELVSHSARSVSSGLLDVARDRRATVVALGSSSTGLRGVVSLGGVAERVLHSADIPVTLAPRGFDTGRTNARISRITVAFGRADKDSDLLVTAARVAADIGATLRVACFAVRPLTAAAGSIEPSAEDLVVGEWATRLESDVRQALRADAGGAGAGVDVVVGRGGTWAAALSGVPWGRGEVLAVGTSSSAVSRFFLGSHASKIVRNSPVPVFLWPRAMPRA
ncbi:universal stress protein [Modestobacter altitudinis]|uniref:universal stress protein n=1 Tax=Modestobacter altitudinis TaxID=2213158 RepID=UPI00110CE86D|nr:universal stress protein [Modestobacter altitudinis]